jgi:hypothetical protein
MPHSRIIISFIFLYPFFFSTLTAQKQYGGVPAFVENTGISSAIKDLKAHSLSSEFRSFLKNANSTPENVIALPTLIKQKTLKSKLNQFKSYNKGKVLIQKINLDERAESYLRLADFNIPRGARLYVIGDNGKQILGAYTSSNNSETRNFMCGPIKGSFVVEYNHTDVGLDTPPFRIEEIYTGTSDVGAMTTGYNTAYECMININCDEGRRYSDEKKGVVRLRMVGEQGIALCTGTLLNNTSKDRTPYVLTAYHCERPVGIDFTPFYDLWYFDFNFEANSCANPINEPQFVAVQGAVKIAEWEETDMMLLKIEAPIPVEANAYFNGWDIRETHLPVKSALIHHPNGDIKKISQDIDTITLDRSERAWDNGSTTPANSHLRAEFDDSTFQPGSSGAPLFDDQGRVIGQLHGGPRSDNLCTIAIAYCGRLASSWEGGKEPVKRLKDWLDPTNTGAKILNGIESESQSQIVKFNGRVITADGIAISNVEVSVSGDDQKAFYTGNDGRFVFDNLSSKGNFRFKLTKNTDVANGISSLDIILITNHILGRVELPNIFQRLAADVSADGRVSSLDLIHITNVILGRSNSFPDNNSWRFEPEVLQMSGGDIGTGGVEFTIIGYKLGDVNFSANPRK